MNRKGATLFIALAAIIYFMFGMLIYQFLKPDIVLTRTSLECSSPDTSGDMAMCLFIDGIIPLVVLGILASAGGYLTDRALR